jgi:GH15 family glucan-1,4-alpha-glucosidase
MALDRGVRMADRLGEHADPRGWAAERDRIGAALLSEAWHEGRRAFTGAIGSDRLDAGVLRLPIAGLLPYDDPRMTSTVEAVESELGDDGLLRRWSGAEDGAFLLASFWLAECHARAGRVERAREVFARACRAANPLGLLAEEVDVDSGEPLGNVPQALSHAGLVAAAQALSDAQR